MLDALESNVLESNLVRKICNLNINDLFLTINDEPNSTQNQPPNLI